MGLVFEKNSTSTKLRERKPWKNQSSKTRNSSEIPKMRDSQDSDAYFTHNVQEMIVILSLLVETQEGLRMDSGLCEVFFLVCSFENNKLQQNTMFNRKILRKRKPSEKSKFKDKEKQRDPKNEGLRRLRRDFPTQCSVNDRESKSFSRDSGGTQNGLRIM